MIGRSTSTGDSRDGARAITSAGTSHPAAPTSRRNSYYAFGCPGAPTATANIGAALAGYLVESADGDRLRHLVRRAHLRAARDAPDELAPGRTPPVTRSRCRTGIGWARTVRPVRAVRLPRLSRRRSSGRARRQLAHHLLAIHGRRRRTRERGCPARATRSTRCGAMQFPGVSARPGADLVPVRGCAAMRLMGHDRRRRRRGDADVLPSRTTASGSIALANGNWHFDGRGWPLQRVVVRLFEEADRGPVSRGGRSRSGSGVR